VTSDNTSDAVKRAPSLGNIWPECDTNTLKVILRFADSNIKNILLVYLGHGQAYPVDQSRAALQGGKLDEEATLKKFRTSPKIPVSKYGMRSERGDKQTHT